MLTRIAFRNILRNRRRSAITLLVVVFGAVAIVVFGGYKAVTFRNLRESTIRGRLGHLQVYAHGYSTAEAQKPLEYGLERSEEIRTLIEEDARVRMTAAQIGLMGLVSNGEKSETFLGTAVEPAKDQVMGSQRLVAGTYLPEGELDAVILGKGLAASMNASPGDYLTIMTTTTGGALNAMDVRVAGIFMSGVKEYDDRAIKMPIEGARQLLQTDKVEKLLVFLHSTDETTSVAADLAAAFAARGWRLEMKNWLQLATFYHQVVNLYNGIFGFLGIVVFAIVILSVTNTIAMSIFERTREIGALMAIGTTRARIRRIFLLEGLFIGIIGGALGLLAGGLLAQIINHGNIMLPPPPGYTVGYRLELLLQPGILLTAFVIAVVTSTLSSVVPAIKASRLKIVDALGHI
ncbi:MAG TPA: FtsX-like permease family protein [Thermoanaerobaculia bacterium]|nr:FtsX-like permease family protein [Thermoanaerobaculia bacterium]